MSEAPRALTLVTDASRMLAEARTLDDIRHVHNLAQRAHDYAKAARLGLDAQNSAAAIRLEAEAKAGELLKRMARSGARQTPATAERTDLPDATRKVPTLEDLGVTEDESRTWQAVAGIPDEERAAYVAEAQQAEQEVTRAGLLRHARTHGGRAWDEAVERVQTPASRRRAKVLDFQAAAAGLGEAFYAIDPPLRPDECKDAIAALRAVLRQVEGPRKLEVVR